MTDIDIKKIMESRLVESVNRLTMLNPEKIDKSANGIARLNPERAPEQAPQGSGQGNTDSAVPSGQDSKK